jgi:hypothetical protein
MSLVRGSTSDNSVSFSSVAGVHLGAATMNGVMPSGGSASRPRPTCDLGV